MGTCNKELGHINQGYALQMQGKNAQTAKELAGLSHQYNKEMYDYTGIQSQMAQMKAAGLNPALMYGQVGAGASTAGGSVGSGSGSAGSAPSGGAPQAPQSQAIAGIGMGMQLGNIMADIDLKKSQADLNEAEADKKRGIDTALAKAQEELTRANINCLLFLRALLKALISIVHKEYYTRTFVRIVKKSDRNRIPFSCRVVTVKSCR